VCGVGGKNMTQTPEILTDRLLMRAFTLDDAGDVFAYARNPNVLRYTTGKTPTKLTETEAFIQGLTAKPKGAFALAVCLRYSPKVIGAIEFGVPDGVTGGIHYALRGHAYLN